MAPGTIPGGQLRGNTDRPLEKYKTKENGQEHFSSEDVPLVGGKYVDDYIRHLKVDIRELRKEKGES